jgi:hypothetical protein
VRATAWKLLLGHVPAASPPCEWAAELSAKRRLYRQYKAELAPQLVWAERERRAAQREAEASDSDSSDTDTEEPDKGVLAEGGELTSPAAKRAAKKAAKTAAGEGAGEGAGEAPLSPRKQEQRDEEQRQCAAKALDRLLEDIVKDVRRTHPGLRFFNDPAVRRRWEAGGSGRALPKHTNCWAASAASRRCSWSTRA